MDHTHHEMHDDFAAMEMPMKRCAMNMLWNTQIENTCIVFRGWHISNMTAFVLSCLAIVALGILYEYLRFFQKSLDRRIAISLSLGKRRSRSGSRIATETEEAALLSSSRTTLDTGNIKVPLLLRLMRAALYGVTVFLSFFLMLVFMTYNAYLILATVLGAAIGHFIFGSTISMSDPANKGMACH